MTDRIDRYLAGTLEWTELTAQELAEVDAVEQLAAETRAYVHERPAPDLTTAVMRRIAQGGLHPEHRAHGVLTRIAAALWTARPMSFQFRPAYALVAVAAAVATVASLAGVSPSPDASAVAVTSAAPEPRLLVRFHFQATDASSVRLAGTFTNWQPQFELLQTAPGSWTVTLALPAGVHDYAFVVDGQRWMPDPFAPSVNDGFGGLNSRLSLLPPEDAQL
jgi:hypothetical protein